MKRKIADAIAEVLTTQGQPMTPAAIHKEIVARGLYAFKADDPVHVVRTQLRRRCVNLEFASAVPDERFRRCEGGRYGLAEWGDQGSGTVGSMGRNKAKRRGRARADALEQLCKQHVHYLEDFKGQLLKQLKELTPEEFEVFSRKLLRAYGLHNLHLTPRSHDGGIDGKGKWRFGTAELDVAFQCKRWKQRTVGRPEVNEFRGSVQGDCELGIFFTTAAFSKQAQEASFRKGAVPIILIDGRAIVDIMIEHGFGVASQVLLIYTSVLDNVIADDEP